MKSKLNPETIKIQAPGAVLEPSGDPLGRLGVSGGVSSRFGGDFWRSWGEDGRKMSEVGARMASSRVLDGP